MDGDRMKPLFLFALLLLAATPAYAQSAKPAMPDIQVEKLDLQKLSPEDKKTVEKMMDPKEQALMLCQAAQIMGTPQSAEYQPGVDAYGRPVASADANTQPQYTVPDRVDIPLDISVLHTVGLVNSPTPELEANVGTVSIFKDGRVTFGNEDKTATLKSYCDTHLGAPQQPAN